MSAQPYPSALLRGQDGEREPAQHQAVLGGLAGRWVPTPLAFPEGLGCSAVQ